MIALLVLVACADVTPAPIFSDGMVLQAGLPAPVFGIADAGESVTVEFRGGKGSTSAGKDGRWIVRLKAGAAGGPFELKIQGKNLRIVRNVLCGEVWHASGQSNMAFPLKKALRAAEEIQEATHPEIRFYRGTTWTVSSPESAGNFSAMGYFFAVELQRRLKGPVGIVDSSVSGAVIQTFLSEDALNDVDLAEKVRRQTDQTVGENYRLGVGPIVPFAHRGTLWCQGEGNRGYPATYRVLLPLLIADWRHQWGQGDTPFLIVQLANSQDRKEAPWEGQDCAIREVQSDVARSVPRAGLVVTIDLGIQDVHYPDKKPAGERLALAARALAYDEKVEYSGPVFESASFVKGRAVVAFTHLGGGLTVKGERLSGFLLSGPDGKFVRAEAAIDGDKVVVSSPRIAEPAAVRYGWERNPECTLTSKEALPAPPFRSDHFDGWIYHDETK